MSDKIRDVTAEYNLARQAAAHFNPGTQPNIGELMRSAFAHGYAQALIDRPPVIPVGNADKAVKRAREIFSERRAGRPGEWKKVHLTFDELAVILLQTLNTGDSK